MPFRISNNQSPHTVDSWDYKLNRLLPWAQLFRDFAKLFVYLMKLVTSWGLRRFNQWSLTLIASRQQTAPCCGNRRTARSSRDLRFMWSAVYDGSLKDRVAFIIFMQSCGLLQTVVGVASFQERLITHRERISVTRVDRSGPTVKEHHENWPAQSIVIDHQLKVFFSCLHPPIGFRCCCRRMTDQISKQNIYSYSKSAIALFVWRQHM